MIDKANVGGSVHELNDTGARGMISTDVFSTAASYAAGDYCIYNNALYKFTAAKSAGAWDTSKVAVTAIASELSALNSRIDSAEEVLSTKITSAGGGIAPEGEISTMYFNPTYGLVFDTKDGKTHRVNISAITTT